MADQSALKIFVLLMEEGEDGWALPLRRLKAFSLPGTQWAEEGEAIGFADFQRLAAADRVDMNGLFKAAVASFPIFDFIFGGEFGQISHEVVVLVRDNQDFLSQLYGEFARDFLDPQDLARHPNGFPQFVEGFVRFGYSTELSPNLLSLKELLLLAVYVRRFRDLNAREAGPDTGEQLRHFSFEEFKTLLVVANKFLLFKFREIYALREETFLANLLWFLFLKAASNPDLAFEVQDRSLRDKTAENIFFKLLRVDLRPDKALEADIVDNLELLFLVFANNFAVFGHPQLALDPKALLRTAPFAQDAAWIQSYLAALPGKPDFGTFLDVLIKVVSVRRRDSSKDSQFRRFVEEHSASLSVQMATRYEGLPKLREDLSRKIHRLFTRFAVDANSLFSMDFLFLCKEFGIVPSQYTNKQALTLFFQANLRDALRRHRRRPDVLDPQRFLYVKEDVFVRLLAELADNFLGGALQLDFEGKLDLLFSKVIRLQS